MRGLIVVMALAASPAWAEAALEATNLDGVFSFAAPPASFDAEHASSAELARYGLPPRPAAGQVALRRAWEALVRATRIMPSLQPTLSQAGPAVHARLSAGRQTAGALQYSNNWSGEVVLNGANGYGPGAFTQAVGWFTIPAVSQAFGQCTGGWDHLFSWVGIDGWTRNQVFQAGTESDAYCANGTTQQYYAAWTEWFPNLSVRISNLPANPGDAMLVWMTATGPTTGTAVVLNGTANQAAFLSMTAPPGIVLKGDSAEWVQERPYWNGVLSTLSNYVQTWMSDEYAFLYDSNTPVLYGAPPSGVVAFPVTMVDNADQPISYVLPLGLNAGTFKTEGSAK